MMSPTNPPPRLRLEYNVVNETDTVLLTKNVNLFLSNGWELHGRLVTDRGYYTQAVKRKTTSAELSANAEVDVTAEDVRQNVMGMLADCAGELKLNHKARGLLEGYDDGVNDLFKEMHTRLIS